MMNNKYTPKGLAITTQIFLFSFGSTLLNAQLLSYTTSTTGSLASVATNASATSLTRVNGSGTPCAVRYGVFGVRIHKRYSL